MATPLLLTAGELARMVCAAALEPDPIQHCRGALSGATPARDLQGQCHVVQRGEAAYQVEQLEDDAQVVAAKIREAVAVHVFEGFAIQHDRAHRWPLQPREEQQ